MSISYSVSAGYLENILGLINHASHGLTRPPEPCMLFSWSSTRSIVLLIIVSSTVTGPCVYSESKSVNLVNGRILAAPVLYPASLEYQVGLLFPEAQTTHPRFISAWSRSWKRRLVQHWGEVLLDQQLHLMMASNTSLTVTKRDLHVSSNRNFLQGQIIYNLERSTTSRLYC